MSSSHGDHEALSIELVGKVVGPGNDAEMAREDRPEAVIFDSDDVTIDSLNYKESQSLQIKILVSFLCLLNVGMAEQTTGILIRNLMDYYHVEHSIVSLIFLVQFMGFLLSASINDSMHKRFGIRGTILSAQFACLLCFGVCSFAPPLPVFIIFYLLNGYSTGCQNSTFNTWGGKLEYHNQIMGLLHSAYGVGSIISPILATHLLAKNDGKWVQWYYILTLNAAVLSFLSYFGFKDETRWKYLYLLSQSEGPNSASSKSSSIFATLKTKLVWLFSAVLFLYVGGEVTLGNWVYNYLIEIKEVTVKNSSYISSGYWLCMTVGRLVLGFYIGSYYEDNETQILLYIAGSISLFSLVFVVIGYLPIQVIAVLAMGFLLGPIFPTIAVVALKRLPVMLHVSGISFISSVGGAGGGIIPYIVGLVSSLAKPGDDSGEGLVWFPLIVLVVFAISLASWTGYWYRSRLPRYSEIE